MLSLPCFFIHNKMVRIDRDQIDVAARLPPLLDFWVTMFDPYYSYNYTVPSAKRTFTTPDTVIASGNIVTVVVWHRNSANPSGVNSSEGMIEGKDNR